MPLLCVCGKSGVGKTTVVRASGLLEIISYTTRQKRPGEADGIDYHFHTHAWMNASRDLFKLDWKMFGENIYGATDYDVNNRDIMVITLDSAIELSKLGVLVYIIWLDGPIRTERGRDVNVDDSEELMKSVDCRMTNDGTVEELAEQIRVIHRSLKMVCDAIRDI